MTLLLLACVDAPVESATTPGDTPATTDSHATDTAEPTETADSPPPDRDGDGSPDDADCAPDDPAVHPGAEDVCSDGIDQDCDGVSPWCRWSGTRSTNTAEFQAYGDGEWDQLGNGLLVPDADGDGRAELVVTTGQGYYPGDIAIRYFFGGATGTAFGSEADTIIRPGGGVLSIGNGTEWGDFDADGVPDVASPVYDGGYGVGYVPVIKAGEVDASTVVHFVDGDLDGLIGSPYVWRAPGPAVGDAMVLTPSGDAEAPFGALWIILPPVLAGRASDADIVVWTDETYRDCLYTRSVGDISGTGIGSLGVSAPQISEGDTDIGAVLLFDSMPADGSTFSDADHRIWGGEASSGGGHYYPAGGADLDGDGYIDVLVTDYQYYSPYYQSLQVFAGPLSSETDREEARTILQDDDTGPLFPLGVATGDFDGDGFSDLAVGENTDDTYGAVRVYYGPLAPGLILSDTANASFQGSTAYEYAYWTDDGMDFNGDGTDDLVIDATNYSAGPAHAGGASFVFFGGL